MAARPENGDPTSGSSRKSARTWILDPRHTVDKDGSTWKVNITTNLHPASVSGEIGMPNCDDIPLIDNSIQMAQDIRDAVNRGEESFLPARRDSGQLHFNPSYSGVSSGLSGLLAGRGPCRSIEPYIGINMLSPASIDIGYVFHDGPGQPSRRLVSDRTSAPSLAARGSEREPGSHSITDPTASTAAVRGTTNDTDTGTRPDTDATVRRQVTEGDTGDLESVLSFNVSMGDGTEAYFEATGQL
ncbi:hypothetical protein IAU59_005124 [Kwoniella sp. CBS 9459]